MYQKHTLKYLLLPVSFVWHQIIFVIESILSYIYLSCQFCNYKMQKSEVMWHKKASAYFRDRKRQRENE